MITSHVLKRALGALAALSLACTSYSIPVNVIGGTTTSVATGNQTSQAQIDAAIAAFLGSSVELYKHDVDGSVESGALASSYQTTINGDASGGLIDYISGQIVGPTAFLLVKDGNQTPAWYLYNLTNLGWLGTEDITMSNFWPANGSISHVTLYGSTATSVPDSGTTVVLLGAGLMVLGLIRRRK